MQLIKAGIGMALLMLMSVLIQPADAYRRPVVQVQTNHHHGRVYHPPVRRHKRWHANRSWHANKHHDRHDHHH